MDFSAAAREILEWASTSLTGFVVVTTSALALGVGVGSVGSYVKRKCFRPKNNTASSSENFPKSNP